MTEANIGSPKFDERAYKYYFLVAGNVVYQTAGADTTDNPMGILSLNGVLTLDQSLVTLTGLSKAQQVLQQHFRTKTQDSNLQIVDVIILNIVALGYMSQVDFNDMNLPATTASV